MDEQRPETTESEDEPLIDENAFGIWVSWFDAEEVEYSQSSDKFPPRIIVFRAAVADYLQSFALADECIALDFGTAVYIEVADGDQKEDLLAWVRGLRAHLQQGDWCTFAAVTHGGRWMAQHPDAVMPSKLGTVRVLASWGPSEPLRKAMAADSMSHDDDERGWEGWGSGLFVDLEVLEALGRKLKNAPTQLDCVGGSFYRISS